MGTKVGFEASVKKVGYYQYQFQRLSPNISPMMGIVRRLVPMDGPNGLVQRFSSKPWFQGLVPRFGPKAGSLGILE